jgi:hypothetical protein
MKLNFNRVSLEAPESWLDASVITLICPDGSPRFRPNVLVTREASEGRNADAYAMLQQTQLRKQYKSFVAHKKEASNGRVTVEHSFKSPENLSVRQQQTYVERDGMMYTLSLTHLEEEFDSVRETFTAIAGSFEIDA